MNTQELFENLNGLWETFTANHNKTSKAAHGRARKALSEIKKAVSDYRKASITEDRAGE
jgi:ElaB/YqjD/DUF883 family membrane-anchored ribosome-binding protein